MLGGGEMWIETIAQGGDVNKDHSDVDKIVSGGGKIERESIVL
jgi:hypothetical protein